MGRFSDAISVFTGAKALDPSVPAPDLYGVTGTPGRRISNTRAARHTGAYGGKEAIDWVMDCVNLYARTASHADYYFKRGDTQLVENPRAPEYKGKGMGQAPLDLVELFKYPNRNSDYTELIQLSVIDLLLAGEFFWFKNQVNPFGQPAEVFRVAPALVEVVPGRASPKEFIYNVPGDEPQTWQPDEVLHVKLPNPHDPWRGLGIISGNPAMYDIALSLDASIRQYYEQGTRLTGVLESDRTIPEPTWEKIKRRFTNLYSGGANAYRVAMLEKGLKFNPISGTAHEAEFQSAQDKTRDRIAAAFSIPTPLLGDVGGSTDRQAVREAQRIFDNKVMRPFLDALQSRVSRGLTQAWDVDWCIEYQYVMPIEDKMDLASNLAVMPVEADELRHSIDLPPLDGENEKFGKKLMVEPGTNVSKTGSGHPSEPPPQAGGAAPYPAGAAGRTGEPTTADAQKALRQMILEGHRKLREVQRAGT